MPSSAPGSLDRQTYAACSRTCSGRTTSSRATSSCRPIRRSSASMLIPAGGFSFMAFSPYIAKPAVDKPDPFARYTPVTEALLTNPPSADWLAWRRTYDAHGFSPLTQITPRNVGAAARRVDVVAAAGLERVRAARCTTESCSRSRFGDKLQALDARTGDLLWQYSHRLAQGAAPNHKRGIALYGDNVYMGTSDAHVIAVDAKTGKLVWDTKIADFTRRESVSAGPLVARGSRDDRHDGHRRRRGARRSADRRPRRGHRRRRVARAHDRAARHAGRRQLERRTGREAQRRVGVEHRQLRSRARARVLRHRQHVRHGTAVARNRRAGRHERGAVHRFDASDRSRQRRAQVGVPALSERSVGSRLGVRTSARPLTRRSARSARSLSPRARSASTRASTPRPASSCSRSTSVSRTS